MLARMSASTIARDFQLEPDDATRLANLAGPLDAHLRMIELRLGIEIAARGSAFRVIGQPPMALAAERFIKRLYADTMAETLDEHALNLRLQGASLEEQAAELAEQAQDVAIKVKRGLIRGRGPSQMRYLHAITRHDINFGIGPAGTGKTYLAMATAITAFKSRQVSRIILTRPAVEAGEKLGFLPGDLQEKVDPYLRPLYDALFDILGIDVFDRYRERGVLEIAPLAYMRGRTLDDSFVILDEAQNTTPEQMKMFLTRLGFDSKAVITGDVTQVDLPRGSLSGLMHAREVLRDIPGISFVTLSERDVVRHQLVQAVIKAYERAQELADQAEVDRP